MKKVVRLTESDLVRLVKKVISEQTDIVTPKRVNFFDTLANNISSKLIGKKFYFGKIGVLENTSITIKKYVDRNHNINIQGKEVKDFRLMFNVTRIEEDLYSYEDKGTRIWSGMLEVRADFKNGVISKNPIVNLYPSKNGEADFGQGMTPERPWTWNQVGGSQIWSQAQSAPNS